MGLRGVGAGCDGGWEKGFFTGMDGMNGMGRDFGDGTALRVLRGVAMLEGGMR